MLVVRVACLPASSARFCRPQACCLPLRCFRAVRPARAFCHTANIKKQCFSEPFFPLSCVVAQLHVHSCSCRGSHLFSMAPLCRQCPCGLFAYGCRRPDDREDNTYGLCAHVRRTADYQSRPLFAQPVCPRQRDYPHEGGQARSAWREMHPYRVWCRARNHCAAGQ